MIPGLAENAETFYTEATALKMFKRLQAFQGGRVVIAVGVPHKCPMAPLEIIFMLHDYFKDRGIRDKVQLHYTEHPGIPTSCFGDTRYFVDRVVINDNEPGSAPAPAAPSSVPALPSPPPAQSPPKTP